MVLHGLVAFLCGCLIAQTNGQWFKDCDKSIQLQVGFQQTIQSEGYPLTGFPLGSSCRWHIEAPGEYQVQAVCDIELVGPSPACPSQRWFVGVNGNPDVNNATYYCGTQRITSVSTENVLNLAYISAQYSGRLTCTLTPICDCGWSSTSRIVGGVDAGPTEFPPMASLYNKGSRRHFCGATIVSSRWVLTAAHCTSQYPQNIVQVAVGLWRTDAPSAYTQFQAIASIVNAGYVPGQDINDVALVQIVGRFQWSAVVAPACLPLYYGSYDFAGRQAIATGWGTDELGGKTATTLQKVDLGLLSNWQCNAQLTNAQVVGSQVCTYAPGKDTCQMDSGGPIWYRSFGDNRLFNVGVVSFGEGCGGSQPGVNSRTTSFQSWIESKTGPLCRRILA